MDPRSSGGRRQLGRHPAAVGVLADGAARTRLRAADVIAVERGLVGMHGRWMVRKPDGSLRVQACLSPVWDTALSLVALAESGVTASEPAIAKAATWLRNEEVRVPGDWCTWVRDVAAKRLVVRVRERSLSGHRRHSHGHARTPPCRRSRSTRRARARSRGSSRCRARAVAGPRSTRTTRRAFPH